MKQIIYNSLLNLFLIVCSVGVIIFCGMAAQVDSRYRSGQEGYKKIRQIAWGGIDLSGKAEKMDIGPQPGPAIDEEALKAQNSDYLFWLYIPGTEVNYPVVRRDNQYYLNHTFYGEENPCGSIFTGCITVGGCGGDMEENTIIHGHNMRDGSMFGGLKKYEEGQYYQDHPELWIYCAGRWIRGRIFSCRIAAEGEGAVYQTRFAPGEKAAYVDAARAMSLYDTGIAPGEDGRLLTLSTCRGREDRLLVQAVLDEME